MNVILASDPTAFFTSFVSFVACTVIAVNRDEVSDLIRTNNAQLMASFKELLQNTVGQVKHANETSVEHQMTEIKKLKYQEPHKFKRRANEDQRWPGSLLRLQSD